MKNKTVIVLAFTKSSAYFDYVELFFFSKQNGTCIKQLSIFLFVLGTNEFWQ